MEKDKEILEGIDLDLKVEMESLLDLIVDEDPEEVAQGE